MAAYIVAIRVLNEGESIVRNFVDELDPLMLGSMIYAALEDAATMAVGANFDTVVTNCAEDKLGILRAELVETLLNHMVAV